MDRIPERLGESERLRSLGNIVDGRVSPNFSEKAALKALVTPGKEKEFFKLIS